MPNQQTDKLSQTWAKTATQALQGKTISHVTYQYPEQKDELGWTTSAPVIVFEDGTQLIPIADEEMNEAGAFCIIEESIENIIPPI
ncbi:MAG: hypothetical protein CLLPBCKN_007192 [Chroococcidiopsis cubana SAG 39.79]|uniref:Uncharacterized protein n=1 Tax=Chroococcidiopsis cubana SAG 39.79 TaxID=388085 RepID=A0AB37URJ5_9CYAN|nr:hypothetical protein [Chroococcidiopsis cubana]MDZ4877757.1 hypothetical protein [Chroococcidiopsis cubana SAG 39.79]PSB62057.1 hypothetical protein C7B79_19645 [Chroococcidiopsis cubana CCALA 043]RUT14041.1 hypothetical protein DSM107010_05240 [Chroococcidiopsis cubana SAG 39.79]